MAKKVTQWRLSRQNFGTDEFLFNVGDEVTFGRGMDNKIMLRSIVVSRNHCVINVQEKKVLITDLQSSNGVYVGKKKIPPSTPYVLKETDVIGFGCTNGAPVPDIAENEKYIFVLSKIPPVVSIPNRIQFQSDDELDDKVAALENNAHNPGRRPSLIFNANPQLKRKHDTILQSNQTKIKTEAQEPRRNSRILTLDEDIINLLSDSDNEKVVPEIEIKRQKLEPINEDPRQEIMIKEEPIKTENEQLEYEAFSVKQEYFEHLNDEPIDVDSDTDSDNEHWKLRLSQSSPGKPFMKLQRESRTLKKPEVSSYSQLDDIFDADNDNTSEEEYEDDLITIPPYPPEDNSSKMEINANKLYVPPTEEEEFDDDIISLVKPPEQEKNLAVLTLEKEGYNNILMKPSEESSTAKVNHDVVDGISNATIPLIQKPEETEMESKNDKAKKSKLVAAHTQSPKKRLSTHSSESKPKSSTKRKEKRHSSSKKHISSSQKEERKKKLREIAAKNKEDDEHKSCKASSNTTKSDKVSVSAKVSTSNRGAFLTDVVQGVVKPTKRKESPRKPSKGKEKQTEEASKESSKKKEGPEQVDDIENKSKQDKLKSKENRSFKVKDKTTEKQTKHEPPKSHKTSEKNMIPLKSLKPLTESKESSSGKPFSKVGPSVRKPLTESKESSSDKPFSIPSVRKPMKSVRFSEAGPTVHYFEIEDGNKLKKTSLCRTSLVDARQKPSYSLEKITLIKILRWNPHWLEEQINNNEPPPILGHNTPPMTIFHSFSNHKQYVQLVGDLLVMEIWDCLSQAYMRLRNQYTHLEMRIESIPPPPPSPAQGGSLELFNLSVNLSVLTSEIRTVPRVGEVMIITFGPEKIQRFSYVHNIRNLPSPPNNKYSFFSVSLHTCFTEKMQYLKRGEVVTGRSVAYINKELTLFEAMDYLAGSPLSEAILRPEPRHFVKTDVNPSLTANSCWTKRLNPSQQMAVCSSVSAALGERPAIQMVQGPPGTGKSSVICAMVMSYFYDSQGRKHQNRGKVLICATSNAAVDELVIRLLKIRHDLPKAERFRMVRVGRAEAMHPRAQDVSSQMLAQRDAARAHAHAAQGDAPPGLAEEIFHLEAKVNMWKTLAADAKEPMRVAYCQGQITHFLNRISLLRTSGGGGGNDRMRGEQLVQAERRIIEGADIVVTTLASAYNHKMRGLKGRIALCIVDEAGQAIEPETLIPLTLDVTKLTLIGDPQQLPGYICSQRAKKHGLGESLFARLTSSSEHWPSGSPVVLLNQQYRMHPDIAEYPNRAFYAGRIRTVAPMRPDIGLPPYCIVSISSGDKGQGASGANEIEAWGVARLAAALSGVLRPRKLQLAVITPYNAHKDLIKKNLRMLQDSAEAQVEVNTVDSFQGQERDVVVVSLARSQGVGFLTDAGRMNVMLTRARHALIVCLNPHAMLKHQQWRTLVEDAQRRKMYRVLPNKVCQSPSAGSMSNDDILEYVAYEKPRN